MYCLKLSIFTFLFVQACFICTISGADKKRSYTDPKEVDADYAIQGEYSGELGSKKEKFGLQVGNAADG